MNKNIVLILAGGKGTRMVGHLPKPLIEVYGRPLIHHLLDTVDGIGGLKPVVVVGHNGKQVKESLVGYDCEFIDQGEPLGTGHAVKVACSALGDADSVVVLYADMPFVSDKTIRSLVDKRVETGVPVIIGTVLRKGDLFSDYGRIIRDQTNSIVKIVERKNATAGELKIEEVNAGFYCFDYSFIREQIKKIKLNPITNEYYLTDVIEIAINLGLRIETVKIPKKEAVGFNSREQLTEFVR